MNLRSAIALVLCSLTGCATLSALGASSETTVVYGADAEANLKKGNDAMASKNYPEAAQYFEYIQSKYPFLEISKAAELRLADCDFEREQYAQARERYQNFVRLHPTHDQVDYAAFRAALSHFKDIPSEFFLLPPAYEKDQVEGRSALSALKEFVKLYPRSTYVSSAEEHLLKTKRRLAEHELYVAEFYVKREKWPAAIGRFREAVERYSGTGFDERIYFGLYEAYLKVDDRSKAIDTLKRLIDREPDSSAAKRARSILQSPESTSNT